MVQSTLWSESKIVRYLDVSTTQVQLVDTFVWLSSTLATRSEPKKVYNVIIFRVFSFFKQLNSTLGPSADSRVPICKNESLDMYQQNITMFK